LDKLLQLNAGGAASVAADASTTPTSTATPVQPPILPLAPVDARSRDSSRSRDRDVR
jgi:membrane protease subunit HflK